MLSLDRCLAPSLRGDFENSQATAFAGPGHTAEREHRGERQAEHMSAYIDMLICMRTTINLPDALVEATKARAAAEGRTMTSLIEEGLRAVLNRREHVTAVEPLPAYGASEEDFLVDLTDHDAVWTALDADGAK